jgi:hypothetical protein
MLIHYPFTDVIKNVTINNTGLLRATSAITTELPSVYELPCGRIAVICTINQTTNWPTMGHITNWS